MNRTIASDRRCPFDSKRMLVEIGQDDDSNNAELVGFVRMVHFCLHCDYREIDENWRRPKLTVVRSGMTGAERLKRLREGTLIPLVYNTSPFPKGEFDEVSSDAS